MTHSNGTCIFFFLNLFLPLVSCTLYQAATVKFDRTGLTHNIVHGVDTKQKCGAICNREHQQGNKCNSFNIDVNKSECHLQFLDNSSIDIGWPDDNKETSESRVWINLGELKTNISHKRCPSSYPYAFKGGLRCCHYPHEEKDDEYIECEARPLTINSGCCFLGKSVPCDGEDSEAKCIDAQNALSSCPWSHPHPYNYYKNCCKHKTEGEGQIPPEHDYYKYCSGNPLNYRSLCCQDDENIDCPYYDKEGQDELGFADKGSRCVAPNRIPQITLP